jgi:hypothetical protein
MSHFHCSVCADRTTVCRDKTRAEAGLCRPCYRVSLMESAMSCTNCDSGRCAPKEPICRGCLSRERVRYAAPDNVWARKPVRPRRALG